MARLVVMMWGCEFVLEDLVLALGLSSSGGDCIYFLKDAKGICRELEKCA